MSVCKVEPFKIKDGKWSIYIKRAEQYIKVNKIDITLKVPALLAMIGDDALEILCKLCHPISPENKSWDEIILIMDKHFNPAPSLIAERYKFRQRIQQLDESISEYVEALKHLSKFCDFGSELENNLRDQIVAGISNDLIRSRLFVESDLKYNKAIEICLSLERTEKDAIEAGPGKKEAVTINYLKQKQISSLKMKDKGKKSIEIYADEMDLREIIHNEHLDSYEEAFYICDLSDIIDKYYNWKRYLPRVTPFYAVKCNDNLSILKLLASLGTGFDCASKGEIKKVMSIGVDPQRIIFANPTKPNSHLNYALAKGVDTMTFDSDFELYKILKNFPKANLVIRIRYDAKKAKCPLGPKFGCDPEREAPGLIELAKRLELNIVGVSFHVGSGCNDFPVFQRAICAARKLFKYAQNFGFDFKLLDIGGGFPGDKGTSLKEASEIINDALEKYMPEDDITIIAEPGRFFVSSAMTLICKIHSKRDIMKDDKIEKIMYFINDGVYGSFNCILYDHQLAMPKCLGNTDNVFYNSSIWGPTCDALDQICDQVRMPKLNIGDYLVFENMGAYTLPIASPFNGFPLPRVKFFVKANDEHVKSIV